MHTRSIYFGNTEVVIATAAPAAHYATMDVDASKAISRAKLLKKVETDKFIAIITPDPEFTFSLLAKEFKVVRAAGGVVGNERGEVLFIELRGRWDLPKGHIEMGESSREAAVREVEEETSVRAKIIDKEPIATTWHAYDTYGEWELKSTDWWAMRAESGALNAQSEEGITRVRWFGDTELQEALQTTYPTIIRVIDALYDKNKNDSKL